MKRVNKIYIILDFIYHALNKKICIFYINNTYFKVSKRENWGGCTNKPKSSTRYKKYLVTRIEKILKPKHECMFLDINYLTDINEVTEELLNTIKIECDLSTH